MRSGPGLEATASWILRRSSLTVVDAGSSRRWMPPSNSLDGDSTFRLMASASSAMLGPWWRGCRREVAGGDVLVLVLLLVLLRFAYVAVRPAWSAAAGHERQADSSGGEVNRSDAETVQPALAIAVAVAVAVGRHCAWLSLCCSDGLLSQVHMSTVRREHLRGDRGGRPTSWP